MNNRTVLQAAQPGCSWRRTRNTNVYTRHENCSWLEKYRCFCMSNCLWCKVKFALCKLIVMLATGPQSVHWILITLCKSRISRLASDQIRIGQSWICGHPTYRFALTLPYIRFYKNEDSTCKGRNSWGFSGVQKLRDQSSKIWVGTRVTGCWLPAVLPFYLHTVPVTSWPGMKLFSLFFSIF